MNVTTLDKSFRSFPDFTKMNERNLKSPLVETLEYSDLLKTWTVNKSLVESIPGLSYYSEYLTTEKESEILSIIDSNSFSTVLERRQQFYGFTIVS